MKYLAPLSVFLALPTQEGGLVVIDNMTTTPAYSPAHLCEKCKKCYQDIVNPEFSCLVLHSPDSCCHFASKPVDCAVEIDPVFIAADEDDGGMMFMIGGGQGDLSICGSLGTWDAESKTCVLELDLRCTAGPKARPRPPTTIILKVDGREVYVGGTRPCPEKP